MNRTKMLELNRMEKVERSYVRKSRVNEYEVADKVANRYKDAESDPEAVFGEVLFDLGAGEYCKVHIAYDKYYVTVYAWDKADISIDTFRHYWRLVKSLDN